MPLGSGECASPDSENHILVFTKYPHPGFAKTRLIPAVGADQAAAISRKLSERCVRTVATYCRTSDAIPIIHYAVRAQSSEADLVEGWLSPIGCDKMRFVEQSEGGLGDRLKAAFLASFAGADARAARKVVVIGVDIPEIDENVLSRAFEVLDSKDVVIGPAVDGGYYLLGMRAADVTVFDNVTWGSEHVFEETLRNCNQLGLSHGLLGKLRDVDLPEDISYFKSICGDVGRE